MLAFRSDIAQTVYRNEVQQLEQRLDLRPQRTVGCPIEGCAATYEVFDAVATTHRRNVRTLRDLLAKSHPHHHAAGKITLNGARQKVAA